MNMKMWVVALAVLSLGATAAEAKRHRKPLPTMGGIWPYGSRYSEPAHFVRLPNGLVVSSYECFYDEGYGRYLACGAGKR